MSSRILACSPTIPFPYHRSFSPIGPSQNHDSSASSASSTSTVEDDDSAVSVSSTSEITPLYFESIVKGNFEQVMTFFKLNPTEAYKVNSFGWLPIHYISAAYIHLVHQHHISKNDPTYPLHTKLEHINITLNILCELLKTSAGGEKILVIFNKKILGSSQNDVYLALTIAFNRLCQQAAVSLSKTDQSRIDVQQLGRLLKIYLLSDFSLKDPIDRLFILNTLNSFSDGLKYCFEVSKYKTDLTEPKEKHLIEALLSLSVSAMKKLKNEFKTSHNEQTFDEIELKLRNAFLDCLYCESEYSREELQIMGLISISDFEAIGVFPPPLCSHQFQKQKNDLHTLYEKSKKATAENDLLIKSWLEPSITDSSNEKQIPNELLEKIEKLLQRNDFAMIREARKFFLELHIVLSGKIS